MMDNKKAIMTPPPPNGQDVPWDDARACLAPDGLLSVIMPAFRLERVIASNLLHVCNLFKGRIPFEVIVVDDGSSDATAARIAQLAAEHPEIRASILKNNAGKGAALLQGFLHSQGSHVLLLDADLDLPPEQVTRFFAIMRKHNADVVIGSKRHPLSQIDYPWQRRLASRVYYGLVRCLIGLPVSDTQTGIKLFRRKALKYAFDRMLVKHFAFDLEVLSILHNRGFRIGEAPVHIRFGGKLGCLTWRNVRQVMTDTLAIFYRLRLLRYYQSLRPLPMPTPPPTVSVLIACPGPSAYLNECLNGLLRQTHPPCQIVILPDAPLPDRDWPDTVMVRPTGAIRPAEKRNLGIRLATGDIVAFIDDDACPVESWIERALPYFSDDAIGAVGGPAITPPRDPLRSAAGGRVYANRFVSGGFRYRFIHERVRDSDDLPSCNLLVRRNLLNAIGGFRTDYWPGEDTLLCLAITRDQQQRIVYDPWVTVFHHRRPLFRPHLRQIARYARHRGFFARRFPETSRRFAYTIPSLFVLGVIAGGALSLLITWLRLPYLAALTLYAGLTLLSAWHPKPGMWFLTWAGVVCTHVVYGIQFLYGLLARRMPEAVQRFDHLSELSNPPRPASRP